MAGIDNHSNVDGDLQQANKKVKQDKYNFA